MAGKQSNEMPERTPSLREMAAAELKKEIVDGAKTQIKNKMRDLHRARQVVANLERELSDLEEEIQGKLDEL
jgi:hypothetical protein